MYRGPGFLAVVWFGSSPTLSPSPVSRLSLFLILPVCRRSSLYWWKRGGGGSWGRTHTIWRQECPAQSCISHSILSVFELWVCPVVLYSLYTVSTVVTLIIRCRKVDPYKVWKKRVCRNYQKWTNSSELGLYGSSRTRILTIQLQKCMNWKYSVLLH